MAGAAVALADPPEDPRPAGRPIHRFTAEMIDPWLVDRLDKVWPGRGEVYWRGRFGGFAQSNDYLVICNDRAVLLAERKPHPMTEAQEVSVIFNWSRDTVAGDWLAAAKSQPMIDLYIHCRRWMGDMGGVHMLCGFQDDLRGDHIVRLWVQARLTDASIPVVRVLPYKRTSRK